MSSKPTQRSKAPGRTAFYLSLGISMAGGLGVLLWPYVLWGYVALSLQMGWSTWGDASQPEPWDGCVPPRTAAERDQWVADSKATGETLCDPDIVNMTFPEADLSNAWTAPGTVLGMENDGETEPNISE